jgi:hypothetical protein
VIVSNVNWGGFVKEWKRTLYCVSGGCQRRKESKERNVGGRRGEKRRGEGRRGKDRKVQCDGMTRC